MPVEYASFRRRKFPILEASSRHHDLFLSAFNTSERVRALADQVSADRKVWIVHEEYGLDPHDLPAGELSFATRSAAPALSWSGVLGALTPAVDLTGARVAIDITGMMRPHIAMLPFVFKQAGVQELVVYYTDPESYVSGEDTQFTKGPVVEVSLVPGMEGVHTNRPGPEDILIVGAGYDDRLVKALLDDKPHAQHLILLGLPSLQPHMYQESVLKLAKASESIRGYRHASLLFAPANDPFATAQVVADRVTAAGEFDHLYLSGVGPKAHVLGLSWYYWCEAAGTRASFIFPFADQYEPETSNGISTVHEYVLELDAVRSLDPSPRRAAATAGSGIPC